VREWQRAKRSSGKESGEEVPNFQAPLLDFALAATLHAPVLEGYV